MEEKLAVLQAKGVRIISPEHTFVDADVAPEQISSGVVLHPFTRLHGAKTTLLAGASIGEEAPTVLVDVCVGKNASIKGGFCRNSLFLDGASVGSGAQIRECCILEEEASVAHSVGLKQTILFPFVTLGSLVNFCDCLMSGGTSRANHGEVGSSYIHFNFTPHQDKATPSLLGDVERGVFLRSEAIFLGGQGGLVGPARVEYGVVMAAGTVWRGDALEPGRLFSKAHLDVAKGFSRGAKRDLSRIIRNNINYIANLYALREWYRHLRGLFWRGHRDAFSRMAEEILTSAITERVARLRGLAGSVVRKTMAADGQHEDAALRRGNEWLGGGIVAACNILASREIVIEGCGEEFLAKVSRLTFSDDDYLRTIKGLDEGMVALGSRWLAGIVDTITADATACLSPRS